MICEQNHTQKSTENPVEHIPEGWRCRRRSERVQSFVLIIIFAVFGKSAQAGGFVIEAQTFLQMPPHCKAKLVDVGERGSSWGYKVPDPRRYEVERYRKAMSGAWTHLHHYCRGLAQFVQLKDRGKFMKARDGNKINSVTSELAYQLRQTSWKPHLSWFKAELYTNYGRVNYFFGQEKQAGQKFKAAISTDPTYLPAYWEWANLYESSGTLTSAVETLKQGLSQAKNPAHIEKFKERIRALQAAAADSQSDTNDSADSKPVDQR